LIGVATKFKQCTHFIKESYICHVTSCRVIYYYVNVIRRYTGQWIEVFDINVKDKLISCFTTEIWTKCHLKVIATTKKAKQICSLIQLYHVYVSFLSETLITRRYQPCSRHAVLSVNTSPAESLTGHAVWTYSKVTCYNFIKQRKSICIVTSALSQHQISGEHPSNLSSSQWLSAMHWSSKVCCKHSLLGCLLSQFCDFFVNIVTLYTCIMCTVYTWNCHIIKPLLT